MGCNSRTSYWDFLDMEQENILNFGPIVCFGSWSTEEKCAGDLKLGSLGAIYALEGRIKTSMASASSSGSYRRARGHSNVVQVPSCLVDGCVADLSNCRDYHRRHKVCEAHSKTPRVTIEGQEKRFCQQCSRFHSLGEFDDTKRSCRKRLDGHNRRRRKPQTDSLSLNSSKYISTHQDPEVMSHGTQYFSNSAVATSSWNNAAKVPNSQLNYITNSFSSSFPLGYSGGKQFSFLQSTADTSVHLSQPHLNPSFTLGDAGSSGSNNSIHKLLLSDGLDPFTNSDRAPSLLSSSHGETFRFNPMRSIQPQAQPSLANTTYNFPSAGSGINGNITCPEMIQNGSDPSHQTISFSWD